MPRSFAQLHERPNYSGYAGAKIRRWAVLQMVIGRLPDDDAMARLSDRQCSDSNVLFRKLIAEARPRQRAALRWEKPLRDRDPPLSSMTPTSRNEPGARRPTKRRRWKDKDLGRDR